MHTEMHFHIVRTCSCVSFQTLDNKESIIFIRPVISSTGLLLVCLWEINCQNLRHARRRRRRAYTTVYVVYFIEIV